MFPDIVKSGLSLKLSVILQSPGLPIAPFESQFFHDDVDDGADFAEVDDGLVVAGEDGGEAEDLWAGTQGQQLRKAKPESVQYAKKAKRVDVKRLKDSIWKGLDMTFESGGASETEVSGGLI
jgi:condensin complex subunit 2